MGLTFKIIFSTVLLLALPGPCVGLCGEAGPGETRQVVLLNSYHKGFLWSDEIARGVKDTLSGSDIELHIEYMDTKRVYGDGYLDRLTDLLTFKYQNRPYAAVITSDNNAFDFFKQRGTDIWGQAPLVFCGVNFISPQELEGLTNATGVDEQIDLPGNFDLITNIHPDSRRILVVTDNTTTGKRIQRRVESLCRPPSPQWPEIQLVYDVTAADLVHFLEGLKPGDIVLFTLFFRDRSGRFFEYDQAARMVASHSPVPVYGTWNFSLGLGIVGGYLTGGYEHGAAAALKVKQILAGKSPDEIPVQYDAKAGLKYDFRQLDRHAIVVPPGFEGELLYRPDSFYSRHKKMIFGVAFLFILLVTAFLGVTHGLLISRRAEREILEREKKYRSLFEASRDGIILTDLDGRFLDCNPAALDIFGVASKDQLLGRSFLDFSSTYQSDQELSLAQFHDIITKLQNGRVANFEWRLQRPDGELLYVSVSLLCMTLGHKAVVQSTARDITDYKRAQQIMVQTEKMMSVGGLAAGMAHEINNPLSGIIQNTDLLTKRLTRIHMPANRQAATEAGIPMEDIRAFMEKRQILSILDTISESGIRISRIVKNMLGFARKSEDLMTTHHMDNIVDKTLELAATDFNLKKQYDFKKIRIIKDYEDHLPPVPCEENKIQQVLLNILANSAQAMQAARVEQPEILIRIRTDPDTDMLSIRIRDNGPGMEEKVRKRVFEPFFTTKPVGEGTGLGLSVSYFIITENHRGEMAVESFSGAGACFIIRLPLKVSQMWEAREYAIPC